MPGFVKTPKDEARWSKAKEAAGKQTAEGSEGYWKLSNYIFHKMGKSEENVKMAEVFKKSLLSIPSATKMPKAKSMPGPGAKPSVFFKGEQLDAPKHSSIEKLRVFLEQSRHKH